MSTLSSRLKEFRSLRADLEASVLPLATSVDGRSFSFQAAVDGLALRLGGYVVLEGEGEASLGQVQSLGIAEVEAGHVGLAPVGGTDITARLPVRLARGQGRVLDGQTAPFRDRLARPATPAEVNAWLSRSAPRSARLAAGTLSFASDVPIALDAGGFDRHTFLCGQSGSGKSYSLGVMLEQLLLETDLRVVIVDPNSDFVHLAETRDDAEQTSVARWTALAGSIAVRSAGSEGDARLRLRFAEIDRPAQGALLRLDPISDLEEYAELDELVAAARPESLVELTDAARSAARPLGLRIRNLGTAGLGIWARDEAGSVLDALEDEQARCLVVDVGSLATREEQALVAESILRRLWDLRARRKPILLVLDEAHNVCPHAPGDALTALATEHAVRIAGEGRKFGIYLLVASQRPQKVHENVLSQCDNLVLMRLNSAADAAFIRELYGFAPPGLVGLSTDFRLGEALVAGKIASPPSLLRFGRRITREGGGDVDASWAARRDTVA
jgi:DNA helicase HerA-like ATPase